MGIKTFLIFLILAFSSEILTAAETQLQLIFYSGNPEIKTNNTRGGIPALAALLKQQRSKDDPVIFLHGGRAIAPSTMSAFDRGTHMIDLLNQLNPNAFSVGKSDFAFEEDELTLRTREASFPFLSANLYDPITHGFPKGIMPYVMLQASGFNIAVFALTSPELMEEYNLGRVLVLDTDDTIKRTTRLLREQGADLVIMMTDFDILGWEKLLADDTVDIILTSDKKDDARTARDNLQLIHGRGDNAALVKMTLKRINGAFSWDCNYSFIPLESISQDSAMNKAVQSYVRQLDRFLAIEIGVTQTELDTRKEMIRTAENAFGNLAADALRSFFNTDIGLMNGGGIRGNRIYPPGTRLTRGDMLREIPFRNHAVEIEVTGKQLLEALENGLSRIEDVKGRFPHISGMNITYNPQAAPYHRVRSVTVNDKQLDPAKKYSLATVNFLANGGDGYTVFKNCKQLDKFGSSKLLWEYVKDYITDHNKIAPKKEGRLRIVSK